MHLPHTFRPHRCTDEQSSDDEVHKPPHPHSDFQPKSRLSAVFGWILTATACCIHEPVQRQESPKRKEIWQPQREMGIHVCADGVGEWVEVSIDEIKLADGVDCIVISQETANKLLKEECHREKLKQLEQPHLVSIGSNKLRCSHQLAASWRWLTQAYTRDVALYVSPELKGKCKVVMPPPKGQSSSPNSSLRPLYNVVLSDEDKKRQQQQTAQASVSQQSALKSSNQSKLDKFTSQIRSNATKIQG